LAPREEFDHARKDYLGLEVATEHLLFEQYASCRREALQPQEAPVPLDRSGLLQSSSVVALGPVAQVTHEG